MRVTTERLIGWLMAAVACVAMVLASAPAIAGDVVTLSDGSVLEGEITREGDGFVFVKVRVGEIEHERMVLRSEIASIERGVREAEPDEDAVRERMIADGATRVAFVTLEDQVGLFFNKDALQRSAEHLMELPENEKPEVVVLWIDSGGGALFELEKLVPYIQEEMKPEFRVVAWIRSAISAAAMTSWVCEEVYMMREGAIGGNTGYRSLPGNAEAMSGEELEQVLDWMEQVSKWGRKEPWIMRAMQVYMTLSADIDADGTVTWYPNDSGEHMVSPEKRILTFHALDAVKFGVAQGIADNKDELMDAMGVTEWVEVGRGADRMMQEFRANVKRAQTELNELYAKLELAVQFADGAPEARERDRQIGLARRYLRQMKALVRKAPSVEIYMGLNDDWFRDQERRLRDMATGGRR